MFRKNYITKKLFLLSIYLKELVSLCYLNVNGVYKLRPMNTCIALELLRRKNFKLLSDKLLTYIRHSSNENVN